MNYNKFKALFPLKGQVTQHILDTADIQDINNCIGALTLQAALKDAGVPKYKKFSWGAFSGLNGFDEIEFEISTQERYNMTTIKEPCEVTFIIN